MFNPCSLFYNSHTARLCTIGGHVKFLLTPKVRNTHRHAYHKGEITSPKDGGVITFQHTTVFALLLRAGFVVVRYTRDGGQWKDVGCGRWS